MRFSILVIVGLLMSGSAMATEKTISGFLTFYDSGTKKAKKRLEENIGAYGIGLEAANFMLKRKGHLPIYCLPKGLEITETQFFSIFRTQAEGNAIHIKASLTAKPMILLLGLQGTFPCPKNKISTANADITQKTTGQLALDCVAGGSKEAACKATVLTTVALLQGDFTIKPMRICIPSKDQEIFYTDVFTVWVTKHLKYINRPALDSVVRSLREKFPCKK